MCNIIYIVLSSIDEKSPRESFDKARIHYAVTDDNVNKREPFDKTRIY